MANVQNVVGQNQDNEGMDEEGSLRKKIEELENALGAKAELIRKINKARAKAKKNFQDRIRSMEARLALFQRQELAEEERCERALELNAMYREKIEELSMRMISEDHNNKEKVEDLEKKIQVLKENINRAEVLEKEIHLLKENIDKGEAREGRIQEDGRTGSNMNILDEMNLLKSALDISEGSNLAMSGEIRKLQSEILEARAVNMINKERYNFSEVEAQDRLNKQMGEAGDNIVCRMIDNRADITMVILKALEGASLPGREDLKIEGNFKNLMLAPEPLRYILKGVAVECQKRYGSVPLKIFIDTETKLLFHVMKNKYIKKTRRCVRCLREFIPPNAPSTSNLFRAISTTINGTPRGYDVFCKAHVVSKDHSFIEII